MIRFEKIVKTYCDTIKALDDVSFDIHDGEFFFITGPSGAGKSTLIRLLSRQEFPTSGSIFFDDLDVTKLPDSLLSVYRQKLGIVFQDLKLLNNLTVRENIELAMIITNKTKKEVCDTTDYLLDIINLQDRQDLFPLALSGGEKQKVAIARALANDPKLVIADEPTGNLDPNSSMQILDLLKKINSWGTTVMVVTHNRDIVDAMNTRVVRIEAGKIVQDQVGGYEDKPEKKHEETAKAPKKKKESKADDIVAKAAAEILKK